MNEYNVVRCPENPVLTARQCPYPAELVFNGGVLLHQGVYYTIFRNDREHLEGTRFRHMDLGMARSLDGVHFQVHDQPVFLVKEAGDAEIRRFYDVRLTEIEGKVYATMAVETAHGLRAGIGVTEDFIHLKLISASLPDNRNLVLFPQKVGGRYIRLERPFTLFNNMGYDIWISQSPDLRFWGESRLLVRHEDVGLGNAKIGPGTPPILTKWGWLSIIHAAEYDPSLGKNGYEPLWQKRYCAYALLLNGEDPSRVLGLSPTPVLTPEAPYEVRGGFRNNVIFPMALIPVGEDTARIYYGVADSAIAMAEASIERMALSCLENGVGGVKGVKSRT